MAQVNKAEKNPIYTHEGGKAKHINPEQQLRRSIMSCMLWEKTFYEDGKAIADRIAELALQVDAPKVKLMAREARDQMKLRHAPLWLLRALARRKDGYIANTLAHVIQRPDELTEFVAMYWKDGKCPLSAQVKKGLAKAFNKFDEYQLAKYNRPGTVTLRDVLFLCHAKPEGKQQEDLFKSLVDNTLSTPDTWETNLSTGKDKKGTWERLMKEKKLGAMALLRNLRNMDKVGVDIDLVKEYLNTVNVSRVLPFRFIAAARYAPQLEPQLEHALMRNMANKQVLPGKTIILVDVSASMDWQLSDRSEMNRIDAACGLAMVARELMEDVEVFSFSNNVVQVPPRRGFALRDAINNSQSHGGTWLGGAVKALNKRPCDRIIVITDEQAHDDVPDAVAQKSYMINVAAYKNGVGYGKWTHIDGWSEAILDYIRELEKIEADQV